eukprot:jgi/Botrbrau1/19666/Bobra.0003s0030.1
MPSTSSSDDDSDVEEDEEEEDDEGDDSDSPKGNQSERTSQDGKPAQRLSTSDGGAAGGQAGSRRPLGGALGPSPGSGAERQQQPQPSDTLAGKPVATGRDPGVPLDGPPMGHPVSAEGSVAPSSVHATPSRDVRGSPVGHHQPAAQHAGNFLGQAAQRPAMRSGLGAGAHGPSHGDHVIERSRGAAIPPASPREWDPQKEAYDLAGRGDALALHAVQRLESSTERSTAGPLLMTAAEHRREVAFGMRPVVHRVPPGAPGEPSWTVLDRRAAENSARWGESDAVQSGTWHDPWSTPDSATFTAEPASGTLPGKQHPYGRGQRSFQDRDVGEGTGARPSETCHVDEAGQWVGTDGAPGEAPSGAVRSETGPPQGAPGGFPQDEVGDPPAGLRHPWEASIVPEAPRLCFRMRIGGRHPVYRTCSRGRLQVYWTHSRMAAHPPT